MFNTKSIATHAISGNSDISEADCGVDGDCIPINCDEGRECTLDNGAGVCILVAMPLAVAATPATFAARLSAAAAAAATAAAAAATASELQARMVDILYT